MLKNVGKCISILMIAAILFCFNNNFKVYASAGVKQLSPKQSYVLNFSNKKLLTQENYIFLSENLLNIAKYEILARHGYVFKDKKFNDYFKSKTWYKPNLKYKVSLSKIEKANYNLLDNQIYKINNDDITQLRVSYQAKKKAKIDLNNDGIIDTVGFALHNDGTCTLSINNRNYSWSYNTKPIYFSIVDVNVNDNYKEVIVEQESDGIYKGLYKGDNAVTDFFYYNGKDICDMGNISDLCGKPGNIQGNGIISTTEKMSILYPWTIFPEYKLSNTRNIISSSFYFEINEAPVFTLKKALTLFKSQGSSDIAVKLKEGDEITLLGTDNSTWCFAKDSSGNSGWFAVDGSTIRELGLSANDVFKGFPEPIE